MPGHLDQPLPHGPVKVAATPSARSIRLVIPSTGGAWRGPGGVEWRRSADRNRSCRLYRRGDRRALWQRFFDLPFGPAPRGCVGLRRSRPAPGTPAVSIPAGVGHARLGPRGGPLRAWLFPCERGTRSPCQRTASESLRAPSCRAGFDPEVRDGRSSSLVSRSSSSPSAPRSPRR